MRTSDEDRISIQSIPSFSLNELETALKKIANLRSADKDDVVVEMIKHADAPCKEILLQFFNKILIDSDFDESWHLTKLQILSKDGDI